MPHGRRLRVARASADRDEVAEVVERVAQELNIPTPPLVDDAVAFPSHPEQVATPLDRVEPKWREKALLSPPDSP